MIAETEKTSLCNGAKRCYLSLLAHQNSILGRWRKQIPDKLLWQVRKQMLLSSTNGIPPHFEGQYLRDCRTVQRICSPKVALGGMTVDQAVLVSFRNMAYKHSIKSSSLCGSLDKEDFLQESYLKILDAMLHWLPNKGASLFTFLWSAVKRRLFNVANQQGSRLTRFTNKDLAIMRLYERGRRETPEASFSDVVGRIGLKPRDVDSLSKSMKTVILDADLKEAAVKSTPDVTEEILQRGSVDEIIALSGLTEVQERLVRLAMDPVPGWQADFAKTYINSATGNPVSRMCVTQMLRTAKKKVASTMNSLGLGIECAT
jgi:DNA-directed RNA polymerase specialized sigma24 family protein